jgi:hypothetical protein
MQIKNHEQTEQVKSMGHSYLPRYLSNMGGTWKVAPVSSRLWPTVTRTLRG